MKDESKFEKLFDDCYEDETENCTDCPLKASLTMSAHSGANYEMNSSFVYIDAFEEVEEAINVDNVLNSDSS